MAPTLCRNWLLVDIIRGNYGLHKNGWDSRVARVDLLGVLGKMITSGLSFLNNMVIFLEKKTEQYLVK